MTDDCKLVEDSANALPDQWFVNFWREGSPILLFTFDETVNSLQKKTNPRTHTIWDEFWALHTLLGVWWSPLKVYYTNHLKLQGKFSSSMIKTLCVCARVCAHMCVCNFQPLKRQDIRSSFIEWL